MALPKKMRAARMHEIGQPLVIEEMDTPTPAPDDVLVRVRTCGIVPNLANILANWPTWYPQYPLPKLPAIFGLDPAGEVAAVGERVHGIEVGDRVYVNPGRSCESCPECLANRRIACRYYTFNGYFGHTDLSWRMFERYPYAGFSEYMTAPTSALVKIPDNVSFEQASRFGYIGTAYSGLKKAQVGATSTVLINGASGTLGLSGVISALAMGARKILGTGRDQRLLDEVKKIAPQRIEVFSTADGSITDWAMKQTNGEGVHAVLDCLGPGASHEPFYQAMYSLRRQGTMVDVGAVQGEIPIRIHFLTAGNRTFCGSLWFETEEAMELAAYAESGQLDLSIFEHHVTPLDDINRAISGMASRHGGFSNFVIQL